MTIELECKIPVADRDTLAERLRALDAEDRGDVYERNWVLDTPDRDLNARQMLLRVRTEDHGETAVVTVKKPASQTKFKSRMEVELTATRQGEAMLLLETLGYQSVWYYEKRRHHWRYHGCSIALDELPAIGSFIEVEAGSEQRIADVIRELQLDPSDHVDGTYRSLFEDYCRTHGKELSDMEFAPGNAHLTLTPAR